MTPHAFRLPNRDSSATGQKLRSSAGRFDCYPREIDFFTGLVPLTRWDFAAYAFLLRVCYYALYYGLRRRSTIFSFTCPEFVPSISRAFTPSHS
ncbi:hypothetical protein LshimejAT787_1200130 [Lyophyllum shimeji]|uniref:Uncharacterized protein n=1 Tax=Lyophyllum shimeji TaxID=47721 RepID=A0A9P3UPB6_LYOSH|nr:hypothetical protein LshimejAT787_1200130 [Lyophyllum shimeji]